MDILTSCKHACIACVLALPSCCSPHLALRLGATEAAEGIRWQLLAHAVHGGELAGRELQVLGHADGGACHLWAAAVGPGAGLLQCRSSCDMQLQPAAPTPAPAQAHGARGLGVQAGVATPLMGASLEAS